MKKKRSTIKMVSVNQQHPADWVGKWKAAAKREGVSLSEWVGGCLNGYLPRGTVRRLSKRPPAHRPKK